MVRRPSGDVELALPADVTGRAVLLGAALVFDGAAVAIALVSARTHHLIIADVRRSNLLAHLRLEQVDRVFLVPGRNHAVLWRAPGTLTVIDLRARRLVAEHTALAPYRAVAIDPTGTRVIAATDDGIEVVPYADLACARPVAAAAESVANDECLPEEESSIEPVPVEENVDAAVALPESAVEATIEPTIESGTEPSPILAALGDIALPALAATPLTPPLAPAEQHAFSAQLFDLVASWCRRALAEGWDTGRITGEPGALPFQIEAAAILDRTRGRATDAWVAAQDAEVAANLVFRAWSRPDAPHVTLARDFGLSPLAIMIVLVAAAPQLWPDLARAYGMVANDPARPACDEHLVAQLLARPASEVARELDAHAPPVRHG